MFRHGHESERIAPSRADGQGRCERLSYQATRLRWKRVSFYGHDLPGAPGRERELCRPAVDPRQEIL